ncbi:poly(ethylene terephthalate) hydrolase family protein [Nocardia inohanensis]|uniref:poly(ethylene terephthalate) hydrolase family protein n=1 Tax=Nocardia inohanensis TaxID=209246 RepID=UPI000A60870E|nr:alpha/beta hydrolase [Nocardia inohanensis]
MKQALATALFAMSAAVVMSSFTAAAAPLDPNAPPEPSPGILGMVYPATVQGPIHATFAQPGPHTVAATQQIHPCDDIGSVILGTAYEYLGGFKNLDDALCTSSFPHGANSPWGMQYYYPTDLAPGEQAPVVQFQPGFTGDPGNYDQAARLWASRGFVVAMPYNFIDIFPTDPLWGLQALIGEEAKTDSPLHGHVDFGRTIIGGHSAGGEGAFWAAAYLPPLEKQIDPRLHILGVLGVAPTPAPTGPAITIPALIMTGTRDAIVWDIFDRWVGYKTILFGPAYIAATINGEHFNITENLNNNEDAALATAWIEHLIGGHPDADAVFVGPGWGLSTDPAFTWVERNQPADQLH